MITVPDFLTLSAERAVFSEETKLDVSIKLGYISSHLTNLKILQSGLKMGKPVERLEHGKINNKTRGENRCLNSKSWATLVCQIKLMEREYERLNLIYNA